MKCSYGCDYEPTDLQDSVKHAIAAHPDERRQRLADNRAARDAKKPKAKAPKRSATAAAPARPTAVAEPVEIIDDDHAETAPVVAERSWRDNLWGRKKEKTEKPGRERKPKTPPKKRVSSAEFLGSMWGLYGTGLVKFGVDQPVGRVMQFQGPAAGATLEAVTKNTPLDRPIQWAAQRADEAEAVRELVELPLLVFLYERANAELATVLEPMMVAAVRRNFTAMVPIVQRQRAEEAKWREAVQVLGLEGEDPVREMLAEIFRRDEVPQPGPRAEEMAG